MAFALVAFVYGRSKLSTFAFDVPNPLNADDLNKLLLVSIGGIATTFLAAWVLNGFLGSWPDAIAYTIFLIAPGVVDLLLRHHVPLLQGHHQGAHPHAAPTSPCG